MPVDPESEDTVQCIVVSHLRILTLCLQSRGRHPATAIPWSRSRSNKQNHHFPQLSHHDIYLDSTVSQLPPPDPHHEQHAYPTSLRPQDIQLPQQARPAILQQQPCRPPPTRKRTSPRSTSSRSRAAPSSSPNSYAETAPLVAELCPAHGYIDPRPNHPNQQIKQFHYSIHTILFQRGVYPAEDFTAYVPSITILPTPPSTLPFWSIYR